MIWSGSSPHLSFVNKTKSRRLTHIQQSAPHTGNANRQSRRRSKTWRNSDPRHRQTTGKTICRCKSNHKPVSQPTKSQPTKSSPTMSSPIMSSPIISSPKPTLQKYHVYHQTQNHPDRGHLEYKMPALKPAEAMKITPVSRWLD